MMGNLLKRIDWSLTAPALVLLFIGLTTLFSINADYFRNQLFFSFLSIGLFLFFTTIDVEMLESLSKPIYIVALVCLLFLLFLGIESRGAVRWLGVLGLRVQFSEIFKPFLAISLAAFLSRKSNTSSKTFFTLFLLLAPIAFLIYKQPDLGSALMYILATLLTLLLYGMPWWWFGLLGGGLLVSIPLLFKVLHGYQQQRILTFLHLTNDPLGTSYNAIQAVIAVGSGMIFGKGLGQGTQSGLRFLPERHTDFIFSTLSEDLGFIGGLLLIVSFSFLLYRLYKIILETESTFEKIFLMATFSLLFIQFFVNIGMNIGILPIVGVTLPFVSYGGSSLLSNAIFLGIASAIASRRKRKSVLEIR